MRSPNRSKTSLFEMEEYRAQEPWRSPEIWFPQPAGGLLLGDDEGVQAQGTVSEDENHPRKQKPEEVQNTRTAGISSSSALQATGHGPKGSQLMGNIPFSMPGAYSPAFAKIVALYYSHSLDNFERSQLGKLVLPPHAAILAWSLHNRKIRGGYPLPIYDHSAGHMQSAHERKASLIDMSLYGCPRHRCCV